MGVLCLSEVADVIHANLTLDELMAQLIGVMDSHGNQQRKDVTVEIRGRGRGIRCLTRICHTLTLSGHFNCTQRTY